jgi:hypothetical protein
MAQATMNCKECGNLEHCEKYLSPGGDPNYYINPIGWCVTVITSKFFSKKLYTEGLDIKQ